MIATDMTTGGSVEERLRWAFKMYDQDGSGEVNYNQYKNYNFISIFNNIITYDQ